MITQIELLMKSLRSNLTGDCLPIGKTAGFALHARNDKYKSFCRIGCIALAMVIMFAAFSIAAEEAKEEKETVKATEITGEISGIGRGYISIVYARDEKKGAEYEMLLPIDKDVKFIRKGLDELAVGDKVRVKCDDYFKTDEEGKGICARRVAKEIQFLSPPVNKLVSEER